MNQPAFLNKGLASIYLVSGDEPLQQSEIVDSIRQKARADGFSNRTVFHVDGSFDWNQVLGACLTQSLFAEKNLIELNLPTGKPGKVGSSAITEVIDNLSTDNVFIIIAGKIDTRSKNSKWYKAIEKSGVLVQVWPLVDAKLEQWLRQRMQNKGLTVDHAGIKLLADSVEGNLLAASQEVEKLYTLYGATNISIDNIIESVADNSRYDVFKLSDCLLQGNSKKTTQVLKGLIGEKLAASVVLWLLLRELRVLASLRFEKQQTGRTDQTFKAKENRWVWGSKQPVYLKAMARGNLTQWHAMIQACAKTERVIKGAEIGDEWVLIEQICLTFCQPKLLKQYGLLPV
ncbi:MAG: DNA polymerase III subunit delta [Cycloclasticus sp.]|nr:MAG: DNA polymerase III subunit delta [Cycloclasticus sp.]